MNKLRIAAILLLSSLAFAQNQSGLITIPQVLNQGLGMASPYTQRPPDITLVPHGPNARNGHVWLQNVGFGLLIVGEVDGDPPDWPRNKDLILERDHVEVWLADAKDPELPPIGWNESEREQVTLPNGADSCADWAKTSFAENKDATEKKCRRWAELQSHYRPYFKRLFMRQYLVTPEYSVESFATPAYDEVISRFASDRPGNEEIPALLKPHSHLQMWPEPGKNRVGYRFSILVPFADFPPLSTTDLSDFRLLVDVFNPPDEGKKVGSYSTSSPPRVYGKPETFNSVRFDTQRHFHLTPCEFALDAPDEYGQRHPAWFIPTKDQDWEFDSGAFAIVNGDGGYPDGPGELSPMVHQRHYFWHGIAESEWICGPHLSYRKGEKVKSFNVHVDEDGFDAHRLPGGDLLIKVGPRVYGVNSVAQCGACPRSELKILRLTADMKIREVLDLGGVIPTDEGMSQDFTLSQDWSQVVEYDRDASDPNTDKPAPWTSKTWCLGTSEYEECGDQQNVQPPDPPLLKDLRITN